MSGGVSVVVCTRNGEQRLPAVLAALDRQDTRGILFERIVVDDGSTDRSTEVAHAAGVTVVRMQRPVGLAAARNAGVSAASGTVIAFTDDDCEPDAAWLTELIEPLSDPAVHGVAGLTLPASRENIGFRYLSLRNPLAPLPAVLLRSGHPLFRLMTYLREGLGPSRQPTAGAELYSVAGANMAFRRSLLEELGGFDEAITFGGEEEDLCRRAHDRPGSARFVYAPGAVVHHHYRPGVRDIMRRARAYGRGNARQAITAGTPPIVYPFPLLTAVAVARCGRRSTRLGATALLLPLLLYGSWATHAWRRRTLEPLIFAYFQLGQETATMLGEVEQYVAMSRSGRCE